ncbi:MAG: UDP-N-acetylglucosamine 2-epimerase (non-hydrolyzing) [bacterium]|nr:UDP-N-acetylglucosamine 2-epimerase (non-hydrolyzing) [bacterium]
MRRVLVVFGTRPEAIKLAPVIKEFGKYPERFQCITCVTAQHRQMLDQVLNLFEIEPDHDLNIMQKNQTPKEALVNALNGLEDVYAGEKSEIVLVQGDTTTTLAASLAAFYQRIKIGHIEAGLRTGDKYNPFPEEINRRLTSHLADFHFVPTVRARDNLLKEGIKEKKIFLTGNTVIDALLEVAGRDYEFKDTRLRELKGKVILVTAHRRESFGQPLENLCLALKEIAQKTEAVEIVYPVHLNPRVQQTVYPLLDGVPNIHLLEPLDYEPFVHLMKKSWLILTDSGGIQEEAPSLGKPVLVTRKVTERPEAVEAGTAKVIGTDKETIIENIHLLLQDESVYRRMSRAINPYGDGRAAERIVRQLESA